VSPYARIVANPDVMRHIGDGSTHTYEQAQHFVHTMMATEKERGWIYWAVACQTTLELIGFCGFGVMDGQLDFGWRYAKRYWGRGLGTEAAEAVLHYSVRTFGFQEIRAVAYTANRASLRIMEKIGMRVDRFDLKYNKQVTHYVWHLGTPHPQ
jgi:RimJ/RimL family protein N-acetyltransferase